MGPMARRSRRRGLVVGAAIGSARANKAAAQQDAPAPAPAATITGDPLVDQLKQLAELKDQGILTQAEFDAKKKQLLGI